MDHYLKSGHYFGDTRQTLNINGIILTEKTHAIGDVLPMHSHQNAYFRNVLGGEWIENYNRSSRECKPLTLSYHPADEFHSDDMKMGGHTFNIEFSFERMIQYNDLSFQLDQSVQLFDNDALNLILQIYYEFHHYDTFSATIFDSLCIELLGITSKQSSINEKQEPVWLKQIVEYINETPELQIDLIQLSKLVNVHPVHLSRSFKKFYRCTLGDYLRKHRISQSFESIKTKNKSLVEIAYDNGFYDQSHFTRAFKRATGFSPKQCRNLLN